MRLKLHRESSMTQGSYRLAVTPTRIVVTAMDGEGVAAAFSCLFQAYLLERNAGGGKTLECVEIFDSPRWEWRGAMLDVSRHFFPVESIERFIDLMWLFRLNRFHLHLTDDQGWRFEVPGFPLLSQKAAWRKNDTEGFEPYGGFYSDRDVSGLCTYAASKGIVVVPEFDLPGHVSAAASAYPGLVCRNDYVDVRTTWGIFDTVLCAGKPESYRFVEAAISKLSALFPGRWLHIGGDEVPTKSWELCAKCNSLLAGKAYGNISALHGHFMRWTSEKVLELGKTPIVWDEALDGPLPKAALVMVWRDHTILKRAVESGYTAIASPWTKGCYLDRKHHAHPGEPGRLGVSSVFESSSFLPDEGLDTGNDLVAGGQANIWTEGIRNERELEYMAFPRLAAIASNLWTGNAIAEDGGFEKITRGIVAMLRSLGKNPYFGELYADAEQKS